jgi:hypothetical protein
MIVSNERGLGGKSEEPDMHANFVDAMVLIGGL